MKEIFERAIEFTGDGLYRYTLEEGILLFANPGFAKIMELGDDPQALIGKPLRKLFTYVEKEGTIRARLRQEGEVHGQLYTFRTLKGNERWVIHDAFIAWDEERGCDVIEAIIKDVTAVKKLDEERIKTQKLESLGILAGGIAHDFNNLLTIILGNVSAMAGFVPLELTTVHKMISAIEKASSRGQLLTQQLLTFSKGGQPAKKLCSIEPIIRESAGFSVQGSSVLLELDFGKDLPCVEVDRGQIGQVIQNLTINAVQAMPQGGLIRISVGHVSLGIQSQYPLSPGEYVTVSISDSGTGIPREISDRIFEPYFTTKSGGTGLGLAVTSSIISRHGGHLSVVSEPDKGSTFSFLLPASSSKTSECREIQKPERSREKGRILVMDDEEPIRELAKIILGRAGYEVELAADAEEALLVFRRAFDNQAPFDVVILDLTIPGGAGGRDVVRQMRGIDPRVRAVACSGYSNDAVMANPASNGFMASLAKPFMAEEALSVIRKVLDKLPA